MSISTIIAISRNVMIKYLSKFLARSNNMFWAIANSVLLLGLLHPYCTRLFPTMAEAKTVCKYWKVSTSVWPTYFFSFAGTLQFNINYVSRFNVLSPLLKITCGQCFYDWGREDFDKCSLRGTWYTGNHWKSFHCNSGIMCK